MEHISKNSKVLLYLLFFWGVIVTIRGFSLSLQDWMTNFGNIYMGYAWLVPVVVIIGLKIENWKIVFKTISFMFSIMILAFIASPYLSHNEEWIQLLRPVNFILIIGLYRFKFMTRLQVYCILFVYVKIAIYSSRRMEFLFLGVVLIFLMIDRISSISIKKIFFKYIIFGFFILFTLVFTVGYEFLSDIALSVIDFQETRVFLFNEIFEDLSKTDDLLFGRGSLGKYYSDFFARTRRYWEAMGRVGWPGDVPDRISVEVGYLQMILKGGFVMLILNVLIYFKAIYLAIFKSNNWFIRRLGYFILIITILTIIELRPTFTPLFIILWMAIGTVLKKDYRDMDDVEINNLIGLK
ncbi:hypothetical protein [Algibacter mikhailovii]|uniref:O-antigen ligase domain-containing protein n=1 Tax=Algibacter mikhailovii TaxID=425498 RepID=A0A918R9F7_9FLAO|nr:hypothetical protein [Algibacter mikhailovii]GGZ89286.1 hypothetical protein GCM10007028_29410 [Algibacter mikhailovii]